MRTVPSAVRAGHPDYEHLSRLARVVIERAGGAERLQATFPELMRDAIDFLLDSVRTGRTLVSELDNVEKTFIGLKVEHFVRDFLDVPKGLRDLVIDGEDVDIKNTTRDTWMIPPETYRTEDPCLLIASDEVRRKCWLGLIIARSAYLNAPNRDHKRSVARAAFSNIWWLVEAADMPRSHWEGFDMLQFRELRKIDGGNKRACEFFRKHLRTPVHRSVLQALLHDQLDYMKRVRGNGGARDTLRTEGIAVLSGFWAADKALLGDLGVSMIAGDEHIAVQPLNPEEETLMRSRGVID